MGNRLYKVLPTNHLDPQKVEDELTFQDSQGYDYVGPYIKFMNDSPDRSYMIFKRRDS